MRNSHYTHLRCLVCKRFKKVTASVFTRSRQTLTFHFAPFRNRAQSVTAKVTFSNNFAQAYCEQEG
jgi:hypothetical protein